MHHFHHFHAGWLLLVLLGSTLAPALVPTTALGVLQEVEQVEQVEQVERQAEPMVQSTEISDALEALIKKHKLPGMVAGFQTQGKPLVVGVAGVRKTKTADKMTVNDQLHIGSCTKAITATMIARLVEKKKLRWDTTIAEGLPDLRKKFHSKYHDVTVKQLLMHRGGVPENAKSWSAHADKPTVSDTRRAILIDNLAKKPEGEPGTYLYSNLGYALVGLIAAKATGKSWEDLIRAEIFEPLDLKSAGFGPPGTKGKTDQPWGHIALGPAVIARQDDNPPALGPAGRVHMSMADWAKFCLQHARLPGTKVDAEQVQLVSDASLKVLHETLDGATGSGKNYALGVIVFERRWGGRVLYHSGSNTMWMASVWISPKNGAVYMAVTNAGTAEHIGGAIDEVYGVLIPMQRKER